MVILQTALVNFHFSFHLQSASDR